MQDNDQERAARLASSPDEQSAISPQPRAPRRRTREADTQNSATQKKQRSTLRPHEPQPLPPEILLPPHVITKIKGFALSADAAMKLAVRTGQASWLQQLVVTHNCQRDALQYAAAVGEEQMVALLALADVDPDEYFEFLRHWVVLPGEMGLTLTQIQELNRARQNAYDAASTAAQRGHLNVVKLLLPLIFGRDCEEEKISYNLLEFITELTVVAASQGHLDVVKLLLPLTDVDTGEEEGYSEMMYAGRDEETKEPVFLVLNAAAAAGHLEVVKFVTTYAYENTVRFEFFMTRLLWPETGKVSAPLLAMKNGHLEVVRFLLGCGKYKWDVEAFFQQAMKEGWSDMVDIICENNPRYRRKRRQLTHARK